MQLFELKLEDLSTVTDYLDSLDSISDNLASCGILISLTDR
jgi:hypothetical protein